MKSGGGRLGGWFHNFGSIFPFPVFFLSVGGELPSQVLAYCNGRLYWLKTKYTTYIDAKLSGTLVVATHLSESTHKRDWKKVKKSFLGSLMVGKNILWPWNDFYVQKNEAVSPSTCWKLLTATGLKSVCFELLTAKKNEG